MPRSRLKYKTSLNTIDTVSLILNVDDISQIEGSDAHYEKSNQLLGGLLAEFEIAINSPDNSTLDIVLPPVIGASDAEATKISIAQFLIKLGHLEDADHIYPVSEIPITKKDGSIHGNTTRNAKAREEVYQFAMYKLSRTMR